MVLKSVKIIAASLVALGTLGAPGVGSAQYLTDDQPSVVVECGPGQRAVMEQRRINGRTQVVARCEGTQVRPVARRSTVQDVRAPQRSKAKTALMIGGGAATGAGVGGALKGTKGALIGAAIGGGSASIYEAVKRR
jgi:hypothetical protein